MFGKWSKSRKTRTNKLAPKRRAYQPRVEALEERTLMDGGGAAPPPGIVSWWTGENTFADLRNLNHGTPNGTVGFTAGMVGQGFYFNGNGWIDVADSASLDLTGELSIEFWFKYEDASQFYGLFAKRTDFGDKPANYGINLFSGGLGLYFNDPTLYGGSDDPPPFDVARAPLPTANQFHHFAGTYRQVDPTHVQLTMFIDGVQVRQITVLGNLQNAVNDVGLTIGASNPTGIERFRGVLDEVTIYNRALTPDEVRRIFDANGGGKIQTPIACDDVATVDEDGSVVINVLANDLNGPFNPFAETNPAHGTITLNADGTFSYTPNANYHGTDSFTYRATVTSNVATVAITINSVNDAPVLAAIGAKTVNEGSLLSFALSASDVDGDALTFSLVSGPAGAGVSGNTFSFTPDDGPASFDVTIGVSDGAASDTETFTITVNNVAPTVEAGGDEVIAKHVPFIRTGSFADPGADSWTGVVNFGDGTGDQALTLLPDGSFLLSHSFRKKGVYTVTVSVSDEDGGVGTDSFIVDVRSQGTIDEIRVGDGTPQRSMVNRVTISFDTIVTVGEGALKLKDGDGKTVKLKVGALTQDERTVLIVTFKSHKSHGGSLDDGQYKLTIDGAKLLDQAGEAIDADGDGVAGGKNITQFFRLFGDANGDGRVNRWDQNEFLAALGTRKGQPNYVWFFDYNADGVINRKDQKEFYRRLGR